MALPVYVGLGFLVLDDGRSTGARAEWVENVIPGLAVGDRIYAASFLRAGTITTMPPGYVRVGATTNLSVYTKLATVADVVAPTALQRTWVIYSTTGRAETPVGLWHCYRIAYRNAGAHDSLVVLNNFVGAVTLDGNLFSPIANSRLTEELEIAWHFVYSTVGGRSWAGINGATVRARASATAAGGGIHSILGDSPAITDRATLTTPGRQAIGMPTALSNGDQLVRVTITFSPHSPPSAPSLIQPDSGSQVDFTLADIGFVWTYYNPSGALADGFVFRRRVEGEVSFQYWDATTKTWSTTEVVNTRAPLEAVGFAGGQWANNTRYLWSVRSRSSGVLGVYSTERLVVGSPSPSVFITEPTPVVTATTYPTFRWTVSDIENDVQTVFRILVFRDDQATVALSSDGFDIDVISANASGPYDAAHNTVDIESSQTSYRFLTPFENGYRYTAFIQVRTGRNSQPSRYDMVSFLVDLDAPIAPTIVAAVE